MNERLKELENPVCPRIQIFRIVSAFHACQVSFLKKVQVLNIFLRKKEKKKNKVCFETTFSQECKVGNEDFLLRSADNRRGESSFNLQNEELLNYTFIAEKYCSTFYEGFLRDNIVRAIKRERKLRF